MSRRHAGSPDTLLVVRPRVRVVVVVVVPVVDVVQQRQQHAGHHLGACHLGASDCEVGEDKAKDSNDKELLRDDKDGLGLSLQTLPPSSESGCFDIRSMSVTGVFLPWRHKCIPKKRTAFRNLSGFLNSLSARWGAEKRSATSACGSKPSGGCHRLVVLGKLRQPAGGVVGSSQARRGIAVAVVGKSCLQPVHVCAGWHQVARLASWQCRSCLTLREASLGLEAGS